MGKKKASPATAAMAGLLAGLVGFLLMAVWTAAKKPAAGPSWPIPVSK